MLWGTRRTIVPHETALQEIEHDLGHDKHVWLMAENHQGKIVGMVYSYNAQFVDEHCFSSTYVDAPFRGIGHGPEIQAMFLNYLFTYFNFRKVYYDVYSYNTMSNSTIRTFGLKEEGIFIQHRYFDGKWHNLMRYAVFREDIERIRAFLAKRPVRYVG